MPTLEELIDPGDAGAEEVRRLLAHAVNPVEVFRSDRARGERALLRVATSTRALLGAVAYRLGGLVFDHGWLRLLAAGSARFGRDLTGWNGPESAPRLPGALLVGDDVSGGFFALDEGAFGGPRGGAWYQGPDDEGWDALDLDYQGLFEWACNGDLDAFYNDVRWPDWEAEVLRVGVDQVLDLSDASGEMKRSRVSIEVAWKRLAAQPHLS